MKRITQFDIIIGILGILTTDPQQQNKPFWVLTKKKVSKLLCTVVFKMIYSKKKKHIKALTTKNGKKKYKTDQAY